MRPTLLALCLGLCVPAAAVELKPCEDESAAKCARVEVPENPGGGERKISLDVMVFEATAHTKRADPLFFLAGGPGQAATDLGPLLLGAFRKVRRTRDLVFVDQRGTGTSNPLKCELPGESLSELLTTEVDLEALAACRDGYDADLRFYTTRYAAADLEAVRLALGYGPINLLGVSYGTRLGLVYGQLYPESTRSLILDGTAPVDIKLPVFVGVDGARALALLERDLGRSIGLDALELPATVELAHPRTGIKESVTWTRHNVAAIVRSALYSTVTASLVPLAIERAQAGDFRALAGLATAGEGDISLGMHLSVVCSEDVPRVTAADRAALQDPFMGESAFVPMEKACADWPRGAVHEPGTVAARTLILSGELDPATPPRWGEVTRARAPNSEHVVVPATGHGAWSQRCVRKMMAAFLDEEPMERECMKALKRPGFFKDELGP